VITTVALLAATPPIVLPISKFDRFFPAIARIRDIVYAEMGNRSSPVS